MESSDAGSAFEVAARFMRVRTRFEDRNSVHSVQMDLIRFRLLQAVIALVSWALAVDVVNSVTLGAMPAGLVWGATLGVLACVFVIVHAILLFRSVGTKTEVVVRITLWSGVIGDSIMLLLSISAMASISTTASLFPGFSATLEQADPDQAVLETAARNSHVSAFFMFLLFVSCIYSVCISWTTFRNQSLLFENAISVPHGQQKTDQA